MRFASVRVSLRASLLGLMLWPAFGACDALSFPSPLRQAPASAGAGDGGDAAEPQHQSLGDACTTADDQCGSDEQGRPMRCFRGTALAGEDFCGPACDPQADAPPGQICTAEGVLLPTCHPHLTTPEADCPARLNCYRISMFEDRGVCIKMPVCSTDRDCPDPEHSTCAAEFVRDLGAAAPFLLLDHLNCTKTACVALATACPSNEGCLAKQYDAQIADICAPLCDANLRCPPNYSCAKTTSGSGAAALCLPGVPGLRCDGPHCVGGGCEDTGAGFSVCSRECHTTADCALLNTDNDDYFCVDGGTGKHCVTPRPFHGANCTDSTQCREDLDEFCSEWDINGPNAQPGECRQHCKADLTCDPRGGLPHTCLVFDGKGKGGCFPGQQGLACKLSSECFEGLACQDVPEEPDLGTPSAHICTRPCGGKGMSEADADAWCAAPHEVNGRGYCGEGFCRPQRAGGQSCSRDAQCGSQLCNLDKKTCVAQAATAPPP